jgi:hypothetical protein
MARRSLVILALVLMLVNGPSPGTATPEVVDLGSAVGPFCMARTGSAPSRAHMLLFNGAGTHAILAYVATGHIAFLDAATRAPVGCIDVGVQAHAAMPTADDAHVIVANQNGKLLQRIATNYATNSFTLEASATLDLATCTTPSGAPCQDAALRPDNAPICPIIDNSGRLGFVTLRGGGLFVVDVSATPIAIVAEYDRATVHPNGCGGIQKARTMYINSGGGTATTPLEAHLYAFDVGAYPREGASAPNTPTPRTVFAHHTGTHDSHGASRQGRHLWVADRAANAIEVVDTVTEAHVSSFSLVSGASGDPAPDLLDSSPDGAFAFASLRGPCPLTANAPGVNNAVGSTPGVGVIAVEKGGRAGTLIGVAPITNPSAPFACPTTGTIVTERADPHAVRVRAR